LLFLTPDGWKSETAGKHPYVRISYKEHILPWLESCLRATYEFPCINQVIIQYRAVVRQITNTNSDPLFMDKLLDYITANPELIRMNDAYNEGVNEVKARVLDQLAEDLMEEIPEHYRPELREGMTGNRFGRDLYGSIRLKPESGQFATTRYGLVIERIDKYSSLVVGIESKWKNTSMTPGEEELLNKLNELLNEDAKQNGTHKADPQQTWNGEWWPTGWHDLEQPWKATDSDVIIELLDDGKRASFAKRVVEKAMAYIETLERLHEEATKSLKN
jgi:hypothetical protein